MTKKLEFDWHIKVPEVLVNGCEFDMWTEEEGLESNCLFKVDEYGFFINWKKEGCVSITGICFGLKYIDYCGFYLILYDKYFTRMEMC